MNALRPALAVLTLACAAGAQSEPMPNLQIFPPSEVTLLEGQTAEVSLSGNPAPVLVKFTRVVADSRCPRNVQCVWAGEVAVLLTFSGAATGELTLKLPGSEATPATGNAGPYRIEVLDVTPYPVAGRPREEPNRVKLAVTLRP